MIAEPQPPEELDVGTDLDLKKNKPFRIVDKWQVWDSVAFVVVALISFVVFAYFFWSGG